MIRRRVDSFVCDKGDDLMRRVCGDESSGGGREVSLQWRTVSGMDL